MIKYKFFFISSIKFHFLEFFLRGGGGGRVRRYNQKKRKKRKGGQVTILRKDQFREEKEEYEKTEQL